MFQKLFFIFLSFYLFTNQTYGMDNNNNNDSDHKFSIESSNTTSSIEVKSNSEIDTQTTSEQSYESHAETNREIDILFQAVEMNNYEIIEQMLLNNNIDLMATNEEGYSLMHIAAYYGSLDSAELLDKYNNLLIHIQNNDNGETPLHSAIKGNQVLMINFLLKKGAFTDATTYSGDSVIHVGIISGSLDGLKTLCENTQRLDLINKPTTTTNYTPLMYAIYSEKKDILLWLLENKAQCDALTFFYAIQSGSLEIIKILCKYNPKLITISDEKFKKNALHIATQSNHEDIVDYLLFMGADIYHYDKGGLLPVHRAIMGNSLSIVEKFYKKDNKIISKQTAGAKQTPLMIALFKDNAQIVSWLIKKGADLKAYDANGNNHVYYAILNSSLPILKMFDKHTDLFYKKNKQENFCYFIFPFKRDNESEEIFQKRKLDVLNWLIIKINSSIASKNNKDKKILIENSIECFKKEIEITKKELGIVDEKVENLSAILKNLGIKEKNKSTKNKNKKNKKNKNREINLQPKESEKKAEVKKSSKQKKEQSEKSLPFVVDEDENNNPPKWKNISFSKPVSQNKVLLHGKHYLNENELSERNLCEIGKDREEFIEENGLKKIIITDNSENSLINPGCSVIQLTNCEIKHDEKSLSIMKMKDMICHGSAQEKSMLLSDYYHSFSLLVDNYLHYGKIKELTNAPVLFGSEYKAYLITIPGEIQQIHPIHGTIRQAPSQRQFEYLIYAKSDLRNSYLVHRFFRPLNMK